MVHRSGSLTNVVSDQETASASISEKSHNESLEGIALKRTPRQKSKPILSYAISETPNRPSRQKVRQLPKHKKSVKLSPEKACPRTGLRSNSLETLSISKPSIKSKWNRKLSQTQVVVNRAISVESVFEPHTKLPDNLTCSLPLERLTGILDRLRGISCNGIQNLRNGSVERDEGDGDGDGDGEDEKTETESSVTHSKSLCLYCDQEFSSEKIKLKHTERVHAAKKTGRSSSRNPAVGRKLKKGGGGGSGGFYPGCSFCMNSAKFQTITNDLDALFQHYLEFHADKYFACKECTIRFHDEQSLDEHTEKVHHDIYNLNTNFKFAEPLHIDVVAAPQSSLDGDSHADTTSKNRRQLKLQARGASSSSSNTISSINSSSSNIFHKDETMLSRLGLTQNRLPRIRKGVRNRRNQNHCDDVAQNQTTTTTAVKTRSKVGRVSAVGESIDPVVVLTRAANFSRVEPVSCTFEDDFYETVSQNVKQNLSCHLDGKLEMDSTPLSPLSPVAISSTLIKTLLDNEIHEATSISAITAFPTLLTAEQFGCDGSGSNKIKRPITRHSWKWKWDSVKKYKYVNEGGRIVKKVKHPMQGLRDLSKLDMWTQLTMRNKYETIQKQSRKLTGLSAEVLGVDVIAREEKRQQIDQLNIILDTRRLPPIILEQNEQAVIKLEGNGDDDERTSSSSQTLSRLSAEIDIEEHIESIPKCLNLIRCTSKNPLADRGFMLSGEWARPRCYVCFGCGAKFDKIKTLEEHKMFRHPYVFSTHYEIVGRELIEGNLFTHFFIPSKAFNRYREYRLEMLSDKKTDDSIATTTATAATEEESLDSIHSTPVSFSTTGSSDTDSKTVLTLPTALSMNSELEVSQTTPNSSYAFSCTKCSRQCHGVLELYRHMLDCSGDYFWLLAKKRKYRYFGAKKRRPLNRHQRRLKKKNLISKDTESTNEEGTPTKRKICSSMSSLPRPRPSDAESIRKMLENLPAKRVCKKIIPNTTNGNSKKQIIKGKNVANTTLTAISKNLQTSQMRTLMVNVLEKSSHEEDDMETEKDENQIAEVTLDVREEKTEEKSVVQKIGKKTKCLVRTITQKFKSKKIAVEVGFNANGETFTTKSLRPTRLIRKEISSHPKKLNKKTAGSKFIRKLGLKTTNTEVNDKLLGNLKSKTRRKVSKLFGKLKSTSPTEVDQTKAEELENNHPSSSADSVSIDDHIPVVPIEITVTKSPSSLELSKEISQTTEPEKPEVNLLANSQKSPIGKRRSKKLNDCIAMLTGKLQEKLGMSFLDQPEVPSQVDTTVEPTKSPEVAEVKQAKRKAVAKKLLKVDTVDDSMKVDKPAVISVPKTSKERVIDSAKTSNPTETPIRIPKPPVVLSVNSKPLSQPISQTNSASKSSAGSSVIAIEFSNVKTIKDIMEKRSTEPIAAPPPCLPVVPPKVPFSPNLIGLPSPNIVTSPTAFPMPVFTPLHFSMDIPLDLSKKSPILPPKQPRPPRPSSISPQQQPVVTSVANDVLDLSRPEANVVEKITVALKNFRKDSYKPSSPQKSEVHILKIPEISSVISDKSKKALEAKKKAAVAAVEAEDPLALIPKGKIQKSLKSVVSVKTVDQINSESSIAAESIELVASESNGNKIAKKNPTQRKANVDLIGNEIVPVQVIAPPPMEPNQVDLVSSSKEKSMDIAEADLDASAHIDIELSISVTTKIPTVTKVETVLPITKAKVSTKPKRQPKKPIETAPVERPIIEANVRRSNRKKNVRFDEAANKKEELFTKTDEVSPKIAAEKDDIVPKTDGVAQKLTGKKDEIVSTLVETGKKKGSKKNENIVVKSAAKKDDVESEKNNEGKKDETIAANAVAKNYEIVPTLVESGKKKGSKKNDNIVKSAAKKDESTSVESEKNKDETIAAKAAAKDEEIFSTLVESGKKKASKKNDNIALKSSAKKDESTSAESGKNNEGKKDETVAAAKDDELVCVETTDKKKEDKTDDNIAMNSATGKDELVPTRVESDKKKGGKKSDNKAVTSAKKDELVATPVESDRRKAAKKPDRIALKSVCKETDGIVETAKKDEHVTMSEVVPANEVLPDCPVVAAEKEKDIVPVRIEVDEIVASFLSGDEDDNVAQADDGLNGGPMRFEESDMPKSADEEDNDEVDDGFPLEKDIFSERRRSKRKSVEPADIEITIDAVDHLTKDKPVVEQNENSCSSVGAKKQRRRRKNELAAIVADQLLESFKEVDKSRIDDLKMLENLAYEKSEDLLLTGMRLTPTTKRKSDVSKDKDEAVPKLGSNTKAKKSASKKSAQTEEQPEPVPNLFTDLQKTNDQMELNTKPEPETKLSQFGGYRTTLNNSSTFRPIDLGSQVSKEDIMPNETSNSIDSPHNRKQPADELPITIAKHKPNSHKKSKKKKKDKNDESENINQLRSGLESFTLSHGNDVPPSSARVGTQGGGLFAPATGLTNTTKGEQKVTTSAAVATIKSSILRPSILSATLDVARIPVFSRDPRLNKNIHTESGKNEERKPATIRQRRKSECPSLLSRTNDEFNTRGRLRSSARRSVAAPKPAAIVAPAVVIDDEDDNYLSEIAKKVNDEIMASEDKDFNVANDGFELANSFLDKEPFERPPTSLSMCSAPNLNDDQSNFDENTNTDLIDMDLDDDISVYTSFSQDVSRRNKGRRRRRRSVLLTRKPRKSSVVSSESGETFNCELCSKSFAKLAALTKHRMTLAHVSKVSEQEYLNAAQPNKELSVVEAVVEKVPPEEVKTLPETAKSTSAPSSTPPQPSQSRIEQISSPEHNYDRYPPNSSSRLTLNPDERLFYECCNILKGSETPLVERSYPIIGTSYTYDVPKKSVAPKATDCFPPSVASEPVGSYTDVNSAASAKPKISVELSPTHQPTQTPHQYPRLNLNQFSDISSDSNVGIGQPPPNYTQSPAVICGGKSVPDDFQASTQTGKTARGGPIESATARIFINQPSQSINADQLDVDVSKRTFTSPLHSTSSQGSTVTTVTTCRLKTKAAMKGYDNLKVSIPTYGLDMQHALERSPHGGCKLTALADIALGSEVPKTATPPTPVKDKSDINVRFTKKYQELIMENVKSNSKPLKKKEIPAVKMAKKKQKQSVLEPMNKPKDVYDFEDDSVGEMQPPQAKLDPPPAKIVIPDRPFKNIGQDEQQTIKFQKPEVFVQPEENSILSTISYSDRDDFNYCSLSEDVEDANDRKDNLSSDTSSNSSAVTAKTFENKSLIMGRIFKKATKSKPLERPPEKHPEPVKKVIPKQELDRLFDKLRSTNSEEGERSESAQKVMPTEVIPVKKPTPRGRPAAKTKLKQEKSKEPAAKSRATTTANTKEINKLQAELGMSPEAIAELLNDGQRKSQRRCTTNRPKKLIEMWSSDEYEEFQSTKDIIALIEEKEKKNQKKRKNSMTKKDIHELASNNTTEDQPVVTAVVAKKRSSTNKKNNEEMQLLPPPPPPKKPNKKSQPKKLSLPPPPPSPSDNHNSDSESDFEKNLNAKTRAKIGNRRKTISFKVDNIKPERKRKPLPVAVKRDSTTKPADTATNKPLARRKRVASEMLYYWSSSSSDDDFGRLDAPRDDDDDIPDNGEHYQQHGWIVGDSHKKLVTLLATAKGTKKGDDCVVKQTKKKF